MWIKICGNTNLEDAKLAADLGADAIGFIFAASKRQLTGAQAAEIARGLPESVERVGVFDSHDAGEIVRVAGEAQLHTVQLHGGFNEPLLEQIAPLAAASGIRIIQTLHWVINSGGSSATQSAQHPPDQISAQLARVAVLGITDRVLIDSKVGASASGGTGIAFDWTAARNLFRSAPAQLRIIVAGGLKPENVTHAIAELAPFGVDISSGVEASVGRKDPAKLVQFLNNARRAATPEPRGQRT